MASKGAYYTHLINSMRWRRLRAEQLTRQPYCQKCEERGIPTAATCVHHIEPVESVHSESEQTALMFNPSNLMSLCEHCHKEIHQYWRQKHTAKYKRKVKQEKVDTLLQNLYGGG